MKKKKLRLRDIKSKSEAEHNHNDGQNHNTRSNNLKVFFPSLVSFAMLIIGIALDYFDISIFKDWLRL